MRFQPTHGKYGTPENKVWADMRRRCRNPRHSDYPDYGGRGITVCERWDLFENFLADMGERPSPRHTLDRIDNSKGYEPGNCRWATMREQSNNRRSCRYLEWQGAKRSIAEWAEVLGLRRRTLMGRIAHGWPVEIALTTPARHKRPNHSTMSPAGAVK